jgi:uncharacterized circularly permuted ATP-grasp superfamily protein/uncharacterized alpha-E superfamily protein
MTTVGTGPEYRSTDPDNPAAHPGPADLLQSYSQHQLDGFDELLDGYGQARQHWKPLLASLDAMPLDERTNSARRIERRVRETGIAFDVFADPNRVTPGWHLDLMPVIISAAEWRWLAAALTQRARLFDALLADLYGAQTLMRLGLIPPELVFSDHAYLRACQGIVPATVVHTGTEPAADSYTGWLPFYAADLARGADGQWRVIDNHTETLAGLGFALANRVVHTQVAGDVFKACNGVRLASFFQQFQSTMSATANRDNARIVLLTPGAHHPDYFSHVYLARYLGYQLVEGPDLRTKGHQVFLKTLEGLQQIDLIIRCVDGRLCDPLVLDPSGFEGPAALLQACRERAGLVVNPVGSALAQNRGLGTYLPALSRHCLGEDLLLADAPRLWLGDPTARRHVGHDLDGLVIRTAQEGTGRPGQAALGQDSRTMDLGARERLLAEIGLHGATLVAEEKIGFSTAPVWTEHGVRPKPFAMRLFVARTASGYQTMPGGLAMTVDPDRAVALSAADGQTRDVWVTSDAAHAPHVSLWRPTIETVRIERSQRVVQSRVADNLFWLGRYCERADWTLRVLRSGLRRLDEDNNAGSAMGAGLGGGFGNGRRAVAKCLDALLSDGTRTTTVVPPRPRPDAMEIERLCRQLIIGGTGYRTVTQTCARLHRVAHLTRDRLSLEAWHTLAKFRPDDTWAISLAAPVVQLYDVLEDGLGALAAFNGLMHENMTRNVGWAFLDMGRRIERAYNLCEAILALFVPMPEPEVEATSLTLLLELADSFITYRSRYRFDPQLALVLDLLLLDNANPRSLSFQLGIIASHMDKLPDTGRTAGSTDHVSGDVAADRALMSSLRATLQDFNLETVTLDGNRGALKTLMTLQLQLLLKLSNAVADRYFNVTAEAPHRVLGRGEEPSRQTAQRHHAIATANRRPA